MSERLLEVARQPDGHFLATFNDTEAPAQVTSWADIRRLRRRYYLTDHWLEQDRQEFIALYGHPFDDWWNALSAACREALMDDPNGPVPSKYHNEIAKSLRYQPVGLGLEGSQFTPEGRAFIARKAAER
jgi:hypothetical protein